MSTSIHNGLVSFATSLYGTDDDPADVTILRDGVANGLLHAADSMAQVRVNVMLPDFSTFGRSAGLEYFETPGDPQANAWYRMKGSPFGEWPLTIHADGTPYDCRLRIAGRSTGGGGGTGTITFRVVLAPNSAAAFAELNSLEDHVFETTGTTSTSAAWLTGATLGSGAYTTKLVLSAQKAAAWTRSVSVYNAVSSPTAGTSIEQCLVSAHVFAKTTNASGDFPALHGLHIAEYCGT